MATASTPELVSPSGYAIFRGHSRTGFGEGPGRPIAHGEQYMEADEPLRSDLELLVAVRPWMTLDSSPADEQTLGTRLEAWSCVKVRDLYFVVRLVGAGLYDRRPGYFAHGRAWPAAFTGACDPGNCLGDPDSFDPPWRDARPARSPSPSDGAEFPSPPVPPDPDAGMRLLANLYQARVLGLPVIMAVPLTCFAAGGPLPALVRFARAALPFSRKRDIAVRIYTRLPEYYLRHLGVDLLVIPEDDAGRALAVRRDAVLLDQAARRVVGAEPGDGVLRYADAIVKAMLDAPDGLLPFSARVDGRPWAARIPSASEAEEVPFIYGLASRSTTPVEMELFLHALFNTLNARSVAIPWQTILAEADVEVCSKDCLIDIVLAEAKTDDAMDLQERAEAAVRQAPIPDSRVQRWWAETPPDPGRIQRLVHLVNARLASAQVAGALLNGVPAGELVHAALKGGVLSQLVDLTLCDGLNAAWLEALVAEADADTIVAVTRDLVRAGPPARLRPLVDACMSRLVDRPAVADAPRRDLGRLLQQVTPPNPANDLMGYLALAELQYRTGVSPVTAPIERLASELTASADRRYLFKLACDAQRWTCLASFEPPESWDVDILDLLVADEGARPRRSFDRLLRLGRLIRPEDAESRRRLVEVIDGAMRVDPERNTGHLIAAGEWLAWRLHTGAAGEDLQRAARAWLKATRERLGRGDGKHLYLEDWLRVFDDLGAGLTRDDAGITEWIDGLENDQAEHVRRAGAEAIGQDPVILAVLTFSAGAARAPRLPEGFSRDLETQLGARPADERSRAVREALAWLCDATADASRIPAALALILERVLEYVSVAPIVPWAQAPDRSASGHVPRARALAKALRERGHGRLADAFEEPPPDLPAQILKALAHGAADAPCWGRVAAAVSGLAPSEAHDAPHSLSEAARRVGGGIEAASPADRCRWATFCEAARRHSLLLRAHAGVVPALQLGAALRPNDPLGDLAAELVALAGSVPSASRMGLGLLNDPWWAALVATFTAVWRGDGLRSGSDRPEAVGANLLRGLDDPRHRAAARAALEAEKRRFDQAPPLRHQPSLFSRPR